MKPSAHILILNYNGRDLLGKYLPSFQESVRRSEYPCRLSVLDNCSTDDSVEILKKSFPDVGVIVARENKVLYSYNEAVAGLNEDIVILMNNDIRVEPEFVNELIKPFLNSKDVFFVTPKCLSLRDGSYEGSKTKATIRYGVFWSSAIYPGHEEQIESLGLTFQGGFGAFDRKKFLELDGYDDLYLPGRLEDADLCFRAYKKGWKCLYQPKSVVYHEGGVSFHRRFGASKTLVINWRNTFLFMLKNLNDTITLCQFIVWLPVRMVYSLLSGKPEFLIGFFQAIPLAPQAYRRRRALKKSPDWKRLSDRTIFDMSWRGDGA